MKKRILIKFCVGIGSIIFCILLLNGIHSFLVNEKSPAIQIHKATGLYDYRDQYEEALKNVDKSNKEAKIISDTDTLEYVVALNFIGTTNIDCNKSILDMTDKYHAQATFFLPGIIVAENPEFVQQLERGGYQVGSNALSGEMHMETLSIEDLVHSFVRSNVILESYLKSSSNLLLCCTATQYVHKVLQAAYASGNHQVVEYHTIINYSSFTNYAEVLGFVRRLKKGTIITVKLDGELDQIEYSPYEVDEDPAKDMESGVNHDVDATAEDKEKRIIEVTEWLLRALKENNTRTILCTELGQYKDEDITADYKTLTKTFKKECKVYHSLPNRAGKISMIFKGLEDNEKLEETLDFLKEKDYRATFFVTGDEILQYPDRIKNIIRSGHEVANGGLSTKDLTLLDNEDAYYEMMKCRDLLLKKEAVTSKFFMPSFGKYNSFIAKAAQYLNMEMIIYNKFPIQNEDTTVKEIEEYFVDGLKNGDIIYVPIGYCKNYDLILREIGKVIDNQKRSVDSIEVLYQNYQP